MGDSVDCHLVFGRIPGVLGDLDELGLLAGLVFDLDLLVLLYLVVHRGHQITTLPSLSRGA